MTPTAAAHVTALVVTFNRAALLARVLDALDAQTRPPDTIVVVDNASADETRAVLAARPDVQHVRLDRNTGSSGGFSAGIRHALAGPATHLWIMDDDAIPAPDALALLLDALRVSGKTVAVPRRQFAAPLVTPEAVAAGQIPADGILRREHVLDDVAEAFRPPAPLEASGGAAWHPADVFTFEGPLATRAAAEAAGPPDPGLFISADDTLFSVAIARALGPLAAALVPAAVMEKQLPPPEESVEPPAWTRRLFGPAAIALWPDSAHWKRAYYLRNRHLVWQALGWRRRRRRQLALHAAYCAADALVAAQRGWNWRARLALNLQALRLGAQAKSGVFVDPGAWRARIGGKEETKREGGGQSKG